MDKENQIHFRKDEVSFIGRFPNAGWHTHGAPVIFVGLEDFFTMEFEDGTIERCKSAVVDANFAHKTMPEGQRMAVYYLSPYSKQSLQFRLLFFQDKKYQLNVIELPTNMRDFEEAVLRFDLSSILQGEKSPEVVELDPRIAQSLEILQQNESPLNREELARSVNLSSSHFNHLFSQSVNTSYRTQRLWVQLGKALVDYQGSGNLTNAALAAGFSDAAHFSNTFRKLLGISPSSVLNQKTHVAILD